MKAIKVAIIFLGVAFISCMSQSLTNIDIDDNSYVNSSVSTKSSSDNSHTAISSSSHQTTYTGSSSSQPSIKYDVYVSGFEYNGLYNVAKYWKNKMPVVLTSGFYDAIASDISVVGTNVYVVGKEKNDAGRWVAKIWINGNPESLGDGTKDSAAEKLIVLNNDIYVAGVYGINACYWKNGVKIDLTDWSVGSYVTTMSCIGGDIYICGSSGGKGAIWKNGEQLDTTAYQYYATRCYYFSGFVIDGPFTYVSGGTEYYSYTWRNGYVLYDYWHWMSHTRIMSMVVVSPNVYAAGYAGDKSDYWINGTGYDIDGSSSACVNDLLVIGSDMYLVGTMYFKDNIYIARYWKNNVPVSLTDGSKNAGATAIHVASNQ